MTFATGGPEAYTGRSMRDSHRGRGIQDPDFDRVAGHVVTTMKELGVSEDLIKEVVALLETVRPDTTNV